MWIRTIEGGWYVHEVRGAVYLSWVSEKDREKAAQFPAKDIGNWIVILESMSGMRLQAVGCKE